MKQLLAVILLIYSYSLQAQTGDKVTYYYKGNKISFPVNSQRLVMQLSAGESLSARRSELSFLLQVPDTSIKAMANEKLVTAKLPPGLSAAGIKSILSALGKQSYINFVHPCFTSAYGKDMGYGDELVVKLKASTSVAVFENMVKQTGCRVLRKYAFARDIYIVSAGAANGYDALAVASRFFETGMFEYAAPDLTLFDGLFTDPNDPLYAYQWAHNNTGSPLQYNGAPGTDMKLQQAWNISTGAGIKIAVIDEGVDTGHADLKANLLQGFDCLSGTANPGDGRPLAANRGHGTACTGIIAAIANNAVGVAGVAPDSRIIPINLSAANGSFTAESNIAAGFDYAWQNGADIISNSWGGGSPSDLLDDAIYRAVTLGRGGKGSVVLFASGNNNAALSYPAVNANVISVGGVNMCGKRKSPASVTCDGESWGASYGTGLDVVAPCVKIATTDISGSGGYNTAAGAAGDYFLRFNGTSSATPNTAGVVALILGANNSLTVNQVRNILESTCDKLPAYNYAMVDGQPNGSWNAETGHGLVNAFNAVQAAMSGFYCNVQVKAAGATRFCPGGSVVINVISPVAGTSYQWRKDGVNFTAGNSITASSTGSYDVVATAANACVAISAPVAVTVLVNTPALYADAGIDTFICAGQPVKLGGNPVAGNGAPWLPEKRAFGMDWQGNSFVKFSLTNPLQLDTIALNMVSNAAYAAENFFTGGDFTPYGYYAITQISNQLIRVDTANGAQQLVGVAPAPAGYLWSGMAWDPSTKNLYALATAASGSILFIIDPLTAALTRVAPVAVVLTEWVAVSNSGNMYVMSDNNYVYKVNKLTGAAVALPNNVGANVIYQQDADFDPVTDSLYLSTIIQSQNFVGDLRTVNTATGVSTIIGTLGGLSQIDATAIAGPGYQYNWLPAAGLSSSNVSVPVAIPLSTTTYTLTVTDMCGNTASSQVTVHVSTPPNAVIAAARDSICVGETVRLTTAANSGYVYQWYLNGLPLAGATDSFYLANAGGAYTVHIVNGSCDSLSATFTVKTCSLLLNNNNPEQLCATYFYDSGNADGNYSDAAAFTKTITAAPGSLPRLTLTSFSTEAGTDILTVYDGTDISSPVLATLSGSPAVPLTYTGSSGALTFRFTSNASVTAAGWAGTIVCYQPAVYRSRASGNAGDIGTWEVKSGNSFVNALSVPQVYDDSIIIQPGHTVSINIPMQLDQLWVKAGAALNVNAPFLLNNGAGTDLQSDGILVVGAAGIITGNGSLVVTGPMDNTASASSNIMVNTMVAGASLQNIAAGGSFGTIYINNPSVTINMVNSLNADTIVINNGTGNTVVMAAANPCLLNIKGKLNLQNGRLVMGNNAVLNLAAGAAVQGANRGSFVEGPVRVNTNAAGPVVLFFPVGRQVYRPVLLEVTHSSAGPSAYQAEVFNTAPLKRSLPGTLNAVSSRSYVNIINSGSQPVSNAVLTLGYDTADGVTDAASLRLAKEDGAAGWIDMGGAGTGNDSGSITATGSFTGLGDFVLANATAGSNAFAVSWLKVAAQLAGRQVKINWTIGNEVNISNYAVERSADGISFTNVVALVGASSLTAAEKEYEAWDRLPEKGVNYYRIRQTAKDGSISYSMVLQVKITDAPDFILWPNPAVASVHVQYRQNIQRLQCYNANGQLVYDVKPGSGEHNIPVQHWAAGLYQVKVTAAAGVIQTRFVKK